MPDQQSPRDATADMIRRADANLRQIVGHQPDRDIIALAGVRADLAIALALREIADAVRSLDGAPGYEMGGGGE
jgi:hypothetical protein